MRPVRCLPVMMYCLCLTGNLFGGQAQSIPIVIQDYGTRGHTFAIKERSLLDVILSRLKAANAAGKIKQLQEQFKARVIQKIARPMALKGIRHTKKARSFYFNPTLTQCDDIKDHRGNVVVKAGTSVNPLAHLSWGEPLLFIDGDEVSHIHWAKNQKGKIILVKGAPLECQNAHKLWFYFDQAGLLTEKFGIEQVPAKVSQRGNQLLIEEIKL